MDPYQLDVIDQQLRALKEATDGVAYAQHTANLIAARESRWASSSELTELTKQIKERLGLGS